MSDMIREGRGKRGEERSKMNPDIAKSRTPVAVILFHDLCVVFSASLYIHQSADSLVKLCLV